MRIVTANNYYYLRGGSERVLLDEERLLKARGHLVVPFSTARDENESTISENFFIPARTVESASLLDRIRGIVPVIHNSLAGRAFGTLLDAYRPNIVHAHNIYGSLTTAILVEARRRGIPAVMTAHDMKLVCASYLSLNHGRACEACAGRHFYHCAARRCHNRGLTASLAYTVEAYFNLWMKRYGSLRCIITPSRFLKALFERLLAEETPIEVIPNGVDAHAILPSFSRGGYALYAGRLSAEKGVLTLIKAAKEASVPLRIVGDGPIRNDAEKLAEGCRQIQFEGYQRGTELSTLFRNAAFVVLPSEWYENAPLCLLEAYAYGKPVLGANIGGIPELVRSGQTGELFASGNTDQLRDALLRMWSHRSELPEMGRVGRDLAEREFSLELHCDRLEKLYSRLIN